MEYHGHRSWNAWNVSLWINNDEDLYMTARDEVLRHGRKMAARRLAMSWEPYRTPDGGKFNYTCIYEALEGMDE